jgi:Holliday junction resolvase
MVESEFQRRVIQRLKTEFPDCVVMKQDASYKQGIPDLVIFHKDRYAMLEVKKSAKASHQPQQDYYISKFNDWSFASFVYPENVDQVFEQLKEVLA